MGFIIFQQAILDSDSIQSIKPRTPIRDYETNIYILSANNAFGVWNVYYADFQRKANI